MILIGKSSFNGIDEWMGLLRDKRGDDASIAIVGNKIDLDKKRVITPEDGAEMAKKYGAFFIEVSAKDGKKVFDLFRTLTDSLLQGDIGSLGPDTDIKLNVPKKQTGGNVVKKKRKCCK